MANVPENASLTDLVSGLVSDVTGLIRKEIDLAKTEASENVSKALSGVEVMLIGLVLAIGAVGVLLSAIVGGLAAFLVSQGMSEPASDAVAALVVAVVIGIIAWAMISKGLRALRARNLKLDRTATSLRRDVDTVKEKM
jgi:uncharacterized membrane protein